MKYIIKPFSFIPALLMMYLIFGFSSAEATESQSMSHSVSVAIVNTVDSILQLDLDEQQIQEKADQIEGVVRKIAHMAEYAVLAITLAFPFWLYGLKNVSLILLAMLVSIVFAATDEYHQLFVAGRSGSIIDVCIDAGGASIGCICFIFVKHMLQLICRYVKKYKSSKLKNK